MKENIKIDNAASLFMSHPALPREGFINQKLYRTAETWGNKENI